MTCEKKRGWGSLNEKHRVAEYALLFNFEQVLGRRFRNAHEVQTPSTGDVLITRDDGWYAIAIVPDRQQIRLADSDHAVRIAIAWAKKNGVSLWRLEDSGPVRLDDQSPL